MPTLKLHWGLLALTLLLIVAALWMWAFPKRVGIPLAQWPGMYQCVGFGLPDATYDRLQVNEQLQLFGRNKEDASVLLGHLAPNAGNFELEYDMGLIHHPKFNLDPFTAAILSATEKDLTITAKEGEREFTQTCKKL